MAQACHFAQEHVDDADAWRDNSRWGYFTCVDYQVACFLAQNTVDGGNGVEVNIIIDKLVERPMKSESEWKKILQKEVDELGGWK